MKKVTMSALLLVILLMVAACGGGGTGSTGGDTGGSEAPAAQNVTIQALTTLKWDPAALTAQAGQPVNITMTSDGALEHNFVWADQPDADFLHLDIGETETTPASRTFDTAGTYEFYCDIPGHREAGMVGELTVN
jgi:uncharacterized cupredoxin-like copper-binding protein